MKILDLPRLSRLMSEQGAIDSSQHRHRRPTQTAEERAHRAAQELAFQEAIESSISRMNPRRRKAFNAVMIDLGKEAEAIENQVFGSNFPFTGV